MFTNPIAQYCLILAAVLLACALFTIYLKVKQYTNHMAYLAKSVDGKTEIVSTLSTRIYLLHGTFDKLKFRCSFTPPVKSDPPEFAISFYGNFPGGLSIKKGKKSDAETSKKSGMEDIQTGDESFDKLFTVRARQGHSTQDYLDGPSRRATIMKFLNRGDSALVFEGASARAVFKGLELTEIEPHHLREYLDLITALVI